MTTEHEARQRLAEASRAATEHLFRQGTPEYDPRAHAKAVELERRAAEEVQRLEREKTS